MIRQRLTSSRGLAAALALFGLTLVAAPRAGAVQVSIHAAFVHTNEVSGDCTADVITIPSVPKCCTRVKQGALRFRCPLASGANGFSGLPFPGNDNTTGSGNISNDPHIEFEQVGDGATAFGSSSCSSVPAYLSTLGDSKVNVCNSSVFLCAAIGYGTGDTSADVAIDGIQFELFKYQDGSNPLDPGSTPPLRTFFVDSPGALPGNTGTLNASLCGGGGITSPTSDSCAPVGPFCVLWDGNVNIQGGQGKTNGQFGFRITAQTNVTGPNGNIQITATRAYPSGSTYDNNLAVVSQKPITMDVTNIHVIRSSPSLVGSLTPVPSEPYNLFYRLSKDSTMTITINSIDSSNNLSVIRRILPGTTRVGEGTPNGSLSNGDSWNGREDDDNFAPPGNYMVEFDASSHDDFGRDDAIPTLLQIGLDPLQITDIRVQPLLEGTTSLAVLDYVLTEPATVYVDIYPPGTQFCNLGANINQNFAFVNGDEKTIAPVDFQPRLGGCGAQNATAPLIQHFWEQKPARGRTITFWDGRDTNGSVVADGDYVFMLYAAMPSRHGELFPGGGTCGTFTSGNEDCRIWTSIGKSGFLNVTRGLVQISQVSPASTVIGTQPAIAGLNPFIFRYSLSRDAIVDMKIKTPYNNPATGAPYTVRTLVNHAIRPGQFGNLERWDDGKDDNGYFISSGTYMAELTATDPLDSTKVSRTTVFFPVDLVRMTDVTSTNLLGGASELLNVSYQLSQPSIVGLNIYPPGTLVAAGLSGQNPWPPCAQVPTPQPCNQITDGLGHSMQPVFSIHGFRAGRLKITEQWDGRDPNGLIVPDGQYIFTLVSAATTVFNTGGALPYEVGASSFPVDRIVGSVNVQRGQILFPTFNVLPDVPTLFNSSNTITLHPFSVQYSLTRQSSVTIQIVNSAASVVRTVIAGEVRQNGILLTDVWDGRDDAGNFQPPGFYIVRAVANDVSAQLSQPSTAQVTISYDPLRIYDVAVSPVKIGSGGSTLFYQVSEPMKVAVKIYRPGTNFDANGNPQPPESTSLVKRLVGIKPARVEIEDQWDGTDLRLSPVPDGNYKFKIVGSTDVRAIDDLTGNVIPNSSLSSDRPIDEIPVVRGGSEDPEHDFEAASFVFPNPVSTPQATFQIYLPFQATVDLRLYNIAGEMIFDHNFGEQAPSYTANGPLTWVWNRANQAGRQVARGLYYAVIRVSGSAGSREILQTTKKVLIP